MRRTKREQRGNNPGLRLASAYGMGRFAGAGLPNEPVFVLEPITDVKPSP